MKYVRSISMLLCLVWMSACSTASEKRTETSQVQQESKKPQNNPEEDGKNHTRNMSFTFEGVKVLFELNDSTAANLLYDQLPLEVTIEDFSNNEKIFYPPSALDTTNTPLAQSQTGTLAYYEPWGDVVMFYDDFHSNSQLFALGHIVSGEEVISDLHGTITLQAE